MKVKFLSVISSSFSLLFMTEGRPTRQANAVLFFFFTFGLAPLRELSEQEETVEVFKAELLSFAVESS